MGEKCALSDENNSLKVITGSPPLDRNSLSSANECHVRADAELLTLPVASPWKHFMG